MVLLLNIPLASYFVNVFSGIRPSQVKPEADTLSTCVVYVPDGALFRVKVTAPPLPVVLLADHDWLVVLFASVIETDALATGSPKSSTRVTVTDRFLSWVFPPCAEYVMESTDTTLAVVAGIREKLIVVVPLSVTETDAV